MYTLIAYNSSSYEDSLYYKSSLKIHNNLTLLTLINLWSDYIVTNIEESSPECYEFTIFRKGKIVLEEYKDVDEKWHKARNFAIKKAHKKYEEKYKEKVDINKEIRWKQYLLLRDEFEGYD